MTQPMSASSSRDYHQSAPSVERHHKLRIQMHSLFVALTGADKRTRQLHKDLQQGKIKLADNVAVLVDAALTNREESKVRAIAHALLAWCSAGRTRMTRTYSQIFCAETRNQGELDVLELAVEQGDLSPQTLDGLAVELREDITIKTEMLEWAQHERFVAQGGR